jgi:predicted anti-sigma-YlaC factor YlaD
MTVMNVFRLQPRTCERSREWASLRLDSELSELEQALLDAHLARCGSCAAYARAIDGATTALRSAPLELLGEPIFLPLRRRRALSSHALRAGTATAAAIACAVGLGTLFGSVGAKSPSFTAAANAARLSRSSITSGPATEADMLVRAPRLAMLKAQLGLGKQRGVGIVDI